MPKIKSWNKDKWFSKSGSILPYDKIEHLLIGLFGLFFIIYFVELILLNSTVIQSRVNWQVIISCTFVGLLINYFYEVKDSRVPYDGVHIEGFSLKDFIAGCLGMGLAVLGYMLLFINIL
jgi:hypothetical protein